MVNQEVYSEFKLHLSKAEFSKRIQFLLSVLTEMFHFSLWCWYYKCYFSLLLHMHAHMSQNINWLKLQRIITLERAIPFSLSISYANIRKGKTTLQKEWILDKDFNYLDQARLPTVFFYGSNQTHKKDCKTLATQWEHRWIQSMINHQGSHWNAYYSWTKRVWATKKSNKVLVHLRGKKHQMKPIKGN